MIPQELEMLIEKLYWLSDPEHNSQPTNDLLETRDLIQSSQLTSQQIKTIVDELTDYLITQADKNLDKESLQKLLKEKVFKLLKASQTINFYEWDIEDIDDLISAPHTDCKTPQKKMIEIIDFLRKRIDFTCTQQCIENLFEAAKAINFSERSASWELTDILLLIKEDDLALKKIKYLKGTGYINAHYKTAVLKAKTQPELAASQLIDFLSDDSMEKLKTEPEKTIILSHLIEVWKIYYKKNDSPKLDPKFLECLVDDKVFLDEEFPLQDFQYLLMQTQNEILSNPKSPLSFEELADFSEILKSFFSAYRDTDAANVPTLQAPKDSDEKTEALYRVYNALIEKFNDTQFCVDCLKSLEKEIVKIAVERNKGLPKDKVTSDQYEYRPFMEYEYPTPTNTFQSIKFDSLLKEAILNRFKQYDLGENIYKLFGIVDPKIMENIFGQYFAENTLDPALLLHGKISHMFQTVLIGEMIKNEFLDVTYGKGEKLTEKEILLFLSQTSVNARGRRLPLWILLADSAHNNKNVVFRDPAALNTFLMKCDDLPNLKALMVNSHCKSLNNLIKAYKDIYKVNMTMDQFWKNIVNTRPINAANAAQKLFIEQYKNSNTQKTEWSNDNFTVIKKEHPKAPQ